MSSSYNKDMRDLLDRMDEHGFKVTPRVRGIRVIAPDGNMRFFTTTVNNSAAMKNNLQWAYSHGLPKPLDTKKKEAAPVAAPVPNPAAASSNGARLKRSQASPAPLTQRLAVPSLAAFIAPGALPPEPPAASVPEPETASPVAALSTTGSTVHVTLPEVRVALPEGHPAHPLSGAIVVDKGNGVRQEMSRPIDPATAKAMLEFNIDNRPIREKLVDSWSRTMASGGWVEDLGDPIRFSAGGKLLDGQKRLSSLIRADKTLRFDVITGLSDSAQDVMDSGQQRSAADQLKINGYKNAMVVASTARVLWIWQFGSVLGNGDSPSTIEILDYISGLSSESVSIEESASYAASSQARRYIPPSVLGACYYVMTNAAPEAAAEFFDKLSTGAELAVDSPILVLRNTADKRKADHTKTGLGQWLFLVTRAWAMWRKGGTTSRLPFPRGGLLAEHIPAISDIA